MKYAKEPFAPKRIIANRSLIASYLVNFFGLAGGLTMIFHVSLYFQAVQGKSASEAGVWLLPSILGSVLGSVFGGLLIQVSGKYYTVTVGAYFAMLLGTTTVTLMTGVIKQSTTGIAIGLLLASAGNGMGITTSLVALIANAGHEDQAIATAVSYLFRSLGSVVGLSVGSTIIQDTLRKSLRSRLSGHDAEKIIRKVRESLSYVKELDPPTRIIVRGSYEQAVHATLWFTVALAACAALSSLFIKEVSLLSRSR
jgi:predicted MFS family arabinose efflux permease